MRLRTLDVLLKAENIIIMEDSRREKAASSHTTSWQILKSQRKSISMLTELSRTCNIDYGDIIEEMLYFAKQI